MPAMQGMEECARSVGLSQLNTEFRYCTSMSSQSCHASPVTQIMLLSELDFGQSTLMADSLNQLTLSQTVAWCVAAKSKGLL